MEKINMVTALFRLSQLSEKRGDTLIEDQYCAMSTTIYDPIREDAQKGFEILGSKLKCAIKGWRECKVGEQ